MSGCARWNRRLLTCLAAGLLVIGVHAADEAGTDPLTRLSVVSPRSS